MVLSGVLTIARMRVSVDKTSVKYLLCKCFDQFICSLKNNARIRYCRQHVLDNAQI